MLGLKKNPISFRVAKVFHFRDAEMIHLGVLVDAGYKVAEIIHLGMLVDAGYKK